MTDIKKNENYIGKVVKIPNEYTIIINATNNQVSIGDKVFIYEAGDEIIDFDSGKVLGTYDFVKAQLEVVESYENYSVCKSVYRENKRTIFTALSPLLEEIEFTNYNALNVNVEQNDNLSIKNPKIILGDPVKLGKL